MTIKKWTFMILMLAEIYHTLAIVERTRLPEDSLAHLKKAKQAMIDGYLCLDSPEIKGIERQIRNAEITVKGLKKGFLKRIPKIQ